MAGLVVGVTFYLHKGERSIFVNGGHQNAVFLVDQLRRCPAVARVIPVNYGEADTPPPQMMLDGLGLEFRKFEDVRDELDLLIECGSQIPPEWERHVHARGGKVVAYKFGNSLILDMEKLIAGRGDQGIHNGTQFDAVWTTPQHMHTNASYYEVAYRCPVRQVPHIWDSTFADKAISEFRGGLTWGYRPRPGPKSIACYDPNIDVVKMCIVPMLVCDLAYRERPELVDKVWITNTDPLRPQLTFQRMALALDICRRRAADGHAVCTFESRYNMVYFHAKHADVCIAWQWENGLNYAYYEMLYGHYPLVHNSELLPDGVGYRYHGFDAHEGAQVLLEVLAAHDGRLEEYNAAADTFLKTVRPDAQDNIEVHQAEIHRLFGVLGLAKRAA